MFLYSITNEICVIRLCFIRRKPRMKEKMFKYVLFSTIALCIFIFYLIIICYLTFNSFLFFLLLFLTHLFSFFFFIRFCRVYVCVYCVSILNDKQSMLMRFIVECEYFEHSACGFWFFLILDSSFTSLGSLSVSFFFLFPVMVLWLLLLFHVCFNMCTYEWESVHHDYDYYYLTWIMCTE